MKKFSLILTLVLFSVTNLFAAADSVDLLKDRIYISCATGAAVSEVITAKTVIIGVVMYTTDVIGNTLTLVDSNGKSICIPIAASVADQPMTTQDLNIEADGITATSPDGSYISIHLKNKRD